MPELGVAAEAGFALGPLSAENIAVIGGKGMPRSWWTPAKPVDQLAHRVDERSLEQKSNDDRQQDQIDDVGWFHAHKGIRKR